MHLPINYDTVFVLGLFFFFPSSSTTLKHLQQHYFCLLTGFTYQYYVSWARFYFQLSLILCSFQQKKEKRLKLYKRWPHRKPAQFLVSEKMFLFLWWFINVCWSGKCHPCSSKQLVFDKLIWVFKTAPHSILNLWGVFLTDAPGAKAQLLFWALSGLEVLWRPVYESKCWHADSSCYA